MPHSHATVRTTRNTPDPAETPAPATAVATTFDELGLAEPILRAVHETGYERPTPIQAQAIPFIMAGRDVLGGAQTGTGKTAAFALPILHRLYRQNQPEHRVERHPGARALVLCPTRELALQIHESFTVYGKHTGLRAVAIYGGVHQLAQTIAIKQGVDILVATPGRLMDLMGQRLVRITLVEVVVLDEADRMLDIGFLPDIRRILAHVPEDRQTLLFSATMPPPIRDLVRDEFRNPEWVQTARVSSATPTVDQYVHFVDADDKPSLLARLLSGSPHGRTLVFTRTKRTTDKLAQYLQKHGVRAVALHGDKEQLARNRAMAAFRAPNPPVLVATDIAARGLDVDGISHVYNYDLKGEPEAYVHRIGRAGRAGATGVAVSFCTPAEKRDLRAIEALVRAPLKRAEGSGPAPSDAEVESLGGSRGERGRGRRRGRGDSPMRRTETSHAASAGAGIAARDERAPAANPRPHPAGRPHVHNDAGRKPDPRQDAGAARAPHGRERHGGHPGQREGAAHEPPRATHHGAPHGGRRSDRSRAPAPAPQERPPVPHDRAHAPQGPIAAARDEESPVRTDGAPRNEGRRSSAAMPPLKRWSELTDADRVPVRQMEPPMESPAPRPQRAPYVPPPATVHRAPEASVDAPQAPENPSTGPRRRRGRRGGRGGKRGAPRAGEGPATAS